MENPAPAGVSLNVSQTSAPIGGIIHVTWDGIANPTHGDLLTLYEKDAPDGPPKASCSANSQSMGTQVPFNIPPDLEPGTYELRLYSNGCCLATSQPFTVGKPQRGELWRAKISNPDALRERRGSEQQGNEKGERICLVVSGNWFNEHLPCLTVVHLTEYGEGKEDTMSQWAVAVKPKEKYVEIDPANSSYAKITPREDFYKHSIIDCSQLWTVFAPSLSAEPEYDELKEVRLNRRYGKLREDFIIRTDMSLQMLVGGSVRYGGKLSFREGDVVKIDFPGRGPRRYCLIVSSASFGALSDRSKRKSGDPFRHRAMIPLQRERQDKKIEKDLAPVNVHLEGKQTGSVRAVAVCSQIYTLDWGARNIDGPVGKVHDMDTVYRVLREYLGLPLNNEMHQ